MSELATHAQTMILQALYILSDLAQYIIKEYAKRKNWTIESHPGSVKMPGDIFKPLPSKDVANDVSDLSMHIESN